MNQKFDPNIMAGYFDYAAATPLDPAVLKSMLPYLSDDFYNPSAVYLAAKRVHSSVEKARSFVAGQIGAKPSEIIFTAGATEANNLAIHGVMRANPDANLVISAIEHEAVMAPALNYKHRLLPVNPDGRVDISKLEVLIDGRTALVSIMLVNNELGTIQPLKEAAAVLTKIRRKRSRQDNSMPLYLHCDASQASLLDLHYSRLGVDLMTINGAKMSGPKQSGALFLRSAVRIKPLISGGGQERNLRSGTENVAAAVGLATALELAGQTRAIENKRLNLLKKGLINKLTALNKDIKINGSIEHSVPSILNITIPGQDNERLVYQLDEKGIMVAAGSACSIEDEPSYALAALGLNEDDIKSSLRLSFGKYTTSDGIDRLVNELNIII